MLLPSQTPETIERVFVNRYLVKGIWIKLEKLMKDIFYLQTHFNKYVILVSIILGIFIGYKKNNHSFYKTLLSCKVK